MPELRIYVKVEVAVLGSLSLIDLMVSGPQSTTKKDNHAGYIRTRKQKQTNKQTTKNQPTVDEWTLQFASSVFWTGCQENKIKPNQKNTPHARTQRHSANIYLIAAMDSVILNNINKLNENCPSYDPFEWNNGLIC